MQRDLASMREMMKNAKESQQAMQLLLQQSEAQRAALQQNAKQLKCEVAQLRAAPGAGPRGSASGAAQDLGREVAGRLSSWTATGSQRTELFSIGTAAPSERVASVERPPKDKKEKSSKIQQDSD